MYDYTYFVFNFLNEVKHPSSFGFIWCVKIGFAVLRAKSIYLELEMIFVFLWDHETYIDIRRYFVLIP